MAWLHGSLKFAANLLPNVRRGVRYVVEIFGGPDRDRTDDLFHAMEARSQLRHRPTVFAHLLFSVTDGLSSNLRGRLQGWLQGRLGVAACRASSILPRRPPRIAPPSNVYHLV